MNEKAVPTWLFAAVVVGLGELTYWLYGRYGLGLLTKISFGGTAVAAAFFLIVYSIRWKKNRMKN
jgi:hypothetical protein